jgi:hypothetical protein
MDTGLRNPKRGSLREPREIGTVSCTCEMNTLNVIGEVLLAPRVILS